MTDLPAHDLTARDRSQIGLPVPPLWLGALAGLITGLITTALVQAQAFTASHAELTAALLALIWVLGLGVVFLGLLAPSPAFAFRPLAVRVAGLATLCATTAALHSGGNLPVVLAFTLALAGAALIAAHQTGPVGLLQFLVSSVLVAGLAGILAALFVGLLELAAALVNAVGFAGPQKVLNDAWVLPSLALAAAGLFVAALRQARWAGTLTQALATLLGFLLPVAALIITLFTFLLPVAALTNRDALYSGLLSSYLYLYLSLTLVTLALTASVTAGRPLPTWADRLSRLAALLLPLYPLLAVYGLSTRALQYGLTPDRALGLAASVWLLVTAVLNAWDSWRKNRPLDPEEQLARPAYLSVLLLAGLSLLLSVPGLRPPELSARSQASRLHDPALSADEATAAVLYLRDRGGPAGKATLTALGKQTLPSAAQVRVQDALALKTGEFSGRYADRQNMQIHWLKKAGFSFVSGSRPLTDTQQELVRESLLKRENNDGSVGQYVCHGLPTNCTLKLYVLPADTKGGQAATLHVLVVGPNSSYDGPWFQLGGQIVVRQGRYSGGYNPPLAQAPSQPFAGGVVASTMTLPVLRTNGRTLFLTEDAQSLPRK
jgi:Domain of unknown function (DUF4153)